MPQCNAATAVRLPRRCTVACQARTPASGGGRCDATLQRCNAATAVTTATPLHCCVPGSDSRLRRGPLRCHSATLQHCNGGTTATPLHCCVPGSDSRLRRGPLRCPQCNAANGRVPGLCPRRCKGCACRCTDTAICRGTVTVPQCNTATPREGNDGGRRDHLLGQLQRRS